MSKLRKLREEAKITQVELAEFSGVSQRAIQQYEAGTRDINKAQAIALHNIAKVISFKTGKTIKIEDLMEL